MSYDIYYMTDKTTVHVYEGMKCVKIYDNENGVPEFVHKRKFDGADRDGDLVETPKFVGEPAWRDDIRLRAINLDQEEKRVEKIIRDDFSEFTDKEILDSKLLVRDYSHKPNGNEARFKKITKEMVELYSRKNTDYGGSFDESLDEDGLLVAKIKFRDKLNRFSQLIDNEALVYDETMRDTLIDLGNYAIMTLMWLDENEDFE